MCFFDRYNRYRNIKSKNSRGKKFVIIFNIRKFDDNHLDYYCESCKFNVSDDTKHCRTCDNCIG